MSGNEILVSVITICYNAEETIEYSIKSVLSQNYKNIEYIIIDGQSNDATLEIIDNYRDQIDLVISEQDDGIYDAFNKGLNKATGEYIQILNADDILEENKIAICVDYMKENNNVDILNGQLRMFSEKFEEYYEVITGSNPGLLNNYHMRGLLHPTFFVRASVYEKLKFRPFNIGMDFDWVLRALDAGFIIETNIDNIVYMKDDGISNVNIINSMIENYKISIINNRHKFFVFIFFIYAFIKKLVYKILKNKLPKNILYFFKPHKKYIKNKK